MKVGPSIEVNSDLAGTQSDVCDIEAQTEGGATSVAVLPRSRNFSCSVEPNPTTSEDRGWHGFSLQRPHGLEPKPTIS